MNVPEALKKYARPFLVWCEGSYPYCLHIHLASVFHGDLRMRWCGRDLIGVTLFLYRPGSVKHRPNGREGWDDFLKIVKYPRRYFKLDYTTGEIIGQRSLQATMKLPEPQSWINVKKLVSPPGFVGARALKDKWSYMTRVDTGLVEHLTRKLDMFEFYFTKGKAFRGRYILRPFGRGFHFYTASADKPHVVGTKYEKLKEGKELGGFLWIRAKDQTPYILSLRAVEKRFVAPFGYSGLPTQLKKLIPSRFQYWKLRSEKDRIRVRDELRDALKRKGLMKYLESGVWSYVKSLEA